MMSTRFPKYCGKCQTFDHLPKDCTRMPAGIGMSVSERAMMAAVRRDRNAVLFAAGAVVLALVLSSWLELPL
jgi:hypothetical protein